MITFLKLSWPLVGQRRLKMIGCVAFNIIKSLVIWNGRQLESRNDDGKEREYRVSLQLDLIHDIVFENVFK